MSMPSPCVVLRSARAVSQGTKFWCRVPIRQIACSATSSSSSSGAPDIEPPNVQRLAQLAQVGVSEQEAAEWGPKISGIVEWFGQLQQIDLEGVPPSLRADVDDANPLRPDQPHDFAPLDDILGQMPQRDGAFCRVPKMGSQGGGSQG